MVMMGEKLICGVRESYYTDCLPARFHSDKIYGIAVNIGNQAAMLHPTITL